MTRACLPALVLAFAACSTDVDGLFSETNGNGGADAASSGSTSKGASSGQQSGSVVQSSSAAQQSSAASTAQQTATSTSVAQSSSASGMLSPTVWCDDAACAPGEICCYYIPAAGQDYCSSAGSCPDEQGWIEITCNGPDDCPNAECCGTIQGSSWVDVSCQPQCGGGNELELCSGDPGACDFGTCQQSMLLGEGYMYCAN